MPPLDNTQSASLVEGRKSNQIRRCLADPEHFERPFRAARVKWRRESAPLRLRRTSCFGAAASEDGAANSVHRTLPDAG
jgi:hypothetical protein